MGKDDTRIRILEAAGPVFAEKGFQAATVREICEAAKMNLASINYYFGDKQQLYIEAVKYAHQPPGEEVEDTDWPAGTPTQEKLKGYILAMLKRMLGVRATWQRQLVMREILQPTAACKQLVEGHFRARFNRLLDILDEVLPPDTPPHKRHQIGFSIVGQCLHYRVAGEIVTMLVGEEETNLHYSVEELAETISRVSLAALGLAPPLSQHCDANPDVELKSKAEVKE
jgi:AcrR family transcriptional regulator